MAHSVAIIGAGLAGLACARQLEQAGWSVHVLDKGRGPGGRISVRRTQKFHFDHGAQYFTAKHPRFKAQVREWVEKGAAALWEAEVVVQTGTDLLPESDSPDRYVGCPGMNSVTKDLARSVSVQKTSRILQVLREPSSGWTLRGQDERNYGPFDWVIFNLPPPQCREILAASEITATDLLTPMQSVSMHPCVAVLLGLQEPLQTNYDAAFLESSALSWVCRNNSKPGRPTAEAWVLHAASDWSTVHLRDSPDHLRQFLVSEFEKQCDLRLPEMAHADVHCWHYSQAEQALDCGALIDFEMKLAACGDWCQGSKVEGAYLSGSAAADNLLQ